MSDSFYRAFEERYRGSRYVDRVEYVERPSRDYRHRVGRYDTSRCTCDRYRTRRG